MSIQCQQQRIILHLDMDAFFAQIEERNSFWMQGKPIVVGADPKKGSGRGVVSTANYEARKYGIRSAMPISIAFKLCPDAIFLSVDFKLYEKVSENIMAIIKKYSPVYQVSGLDEAYLEISFLKSYKKAQDLAKKIKKEVFSKEKLTCTIGIGPNKMIAKIASKKAKPNGLMVVLPSEVQNFLDPLDIEDLPGIGPKTAAKIKAIRINKIFELKKISEMHLMELFGKFGKNICERAQGIDKDPILIDRMVKSISKEHTFEEDTKDPEIIFKIFERIINDINQELLAKNLKFKNISAICRYQGFETHSKAKTLPQPTNNLKILEKEGKNLLLRLLIKSSKPIRLVGLRVSLL